MDQPKAPCDQSRVKQVIEACIGGHLNIVQAALNENSVYACQQDNETGLSPLMAAASVGNGALCGLLLDHGAPWNALDRNGRCAGDFATSNGHWGVVNSLVEWGTRAELILGALERSVRESNGNESQSISNSMIPVEQQPSTKPDYLRQRLQYSDDGKALLDADKDAVMMEWERPLMKAHAQIILDGQKQKRVLNIGFGIGIIDSAIQEYTPDLHVIVEAHPDVHKRMIHDQWDKKHNVRICFGKWQDSLPTLINEGLQFDAIFFDTYGEHYLDLEDFHQSMARLLHRPSGIYSFFNGLAPDNLFFHGVACQCVKLQLSQLGFDTEFLNCDIQVKDSEWEGIRRKYWHGRDTYYLPRVTWNANFLSSGSLQLDPMLREIQDKKLHMDRPEASEMEAKKQRHS